MKSDLYSRKWEKFLKRVRPFRFVPFVEFVLASGSLATGKVHEGSDFDVMVGVRPGRIYTARFFAIVIFEIFGYRRRVEDYRGDVSDKICLNHFVTNKRYKLEPPYSGSWEELYRSLAPVMGDEEEMKRFFEANDWLVPKRIYEKDGRYLGNGKSILGRFLERALSGGMGNSLERYLKRIQVSRIERGLDKALGYKGRVFWSDDELEFHPDRSKFEK